jgi:hypothetical protein
MAIVEPTTPIDTLNPYELPEIVRRALANWLSDFEAAVASPS